MIRVAQDIYDNAVEFLRTFGAFQLFFLRLLRHTPEMLFTRPTVIVQQVYNAGALSLVIIMVCGLFVGAVLALQAYSNMSIFNAEDWTGVAAHLALVKELGPVMTAILFAARAGTALTSEIGLMKATDRQSREARPRAEVSRRRYLDAPARRYFQRSGHVWRASCRR